MPKYKLVFLGDVAVGKTAIVNRFMNDVFNEDYQATIGIDFLSKTMEVDGRMVRLQLWDTAGQERFRSLIPNYIRDSSIAVVVFDVASEPSFANVEKWVQDVKAERGESAVVMFVGNKLDKADERKVSTEAAAAKAKELGGEYLETSAKTGENIQGLFDKIAEVLPTLDTRQSLPVVKKDVIEIRRNDTPAEAAPAAASSTPPPAAPVKECKC